MEADNKLSSKHTVVKVRLKVTYVHVFFTVKLENGSLGGICLLDDKDVLIVLSVTDVQKNK